MIELDAFTTLESEVNMLLIAITLTKVAWDMDGGSDGWGKGGMHAFVPQLM